MAPPPHRAYHVQGHGPHHPVLPAWLQLVEVPVCEQKRPVPAFVEAIHLRDRCSQGHLPAPGGSPAGVVGGLASLRPLSH